MGSSQNLWVQILVSPQSSISVSLCLLEIPLSHSATRSVILGGHCLPALPSVQRVVWRLTATAVGEGSLQWGPSEPGQGGDTAAISLCLFVWGPLADGRKEIATC